MSEKSHADDCLQILAILALVHLCDELVPVIRWPQEEELKASMPRRIPNLKESAQLAYSSHLPLESFLRLMFVSPQDLIYLIILVGGAALLP